MKFELLDFDDKHYASNILQSDTILKWNTLGHTHNLIIRSEFGDDIKFTAEDKAGLEKHENDSILSGKEIRYAGKRFFAFVPRGYVNNYQFTTSPARYAVFCCEYDPATDVCKLYLPNEACLYQCDVSFNVKIAIKHVEIKRGFFERLSGKEPEKDYYIVFIPSVPGYKDGSLHYAFDGYKYQYPITRAMLGKPLNILSCGSKPPKIEGSSGNGYKILVQHTI